MPKHLSRSSRTNQLKRKEAGPSLTAPEIITHVYIILMSSVFILAYNANYIDIQDFKSRLFLYLTGMYLFAEVLLLAIQFFLGERSFLITLRKRILVKNRLIFPLIFAAAVLAGWILSEWPAEAAFGIAGRQFGAVHLLLCVALYLSVTGFYRSGSIVITAFAASVAIELFVGILNLWGIDPLGMYMDLIEEQHSFFIGTLGNKNVTANFLCLVLPIIMVLFIRAESRIRRSVYCVLLGMGFYYGLGVSSDSFVLGMTAAFLVLLWYCLTEEGKLEVLYQILLLFVLSLWAMLFSVKGYPVSPFFREYPNDGILGTLMNLQMLLTVSGIFIAICLILEGIRRKGGRRILIKTRNILFLLFAAAALTMLAAAVVVNLIPGDQQEALPGLLRKLVLEDSFGSNRGYIWKKTVGAFAGLPLIKKMIGIGSDCFYLLMTPLCGEEATTLYGAPFADAHNEFLQFLLTCGVLGVIGYFGTMLTGCVKPRSLNSQHSLQSPAESRDISMTLFACQTVIAAYLAQGLVNNPQTVTTPLLFLFLGICNAGIS